MMSCDGSMVSRDEASPRTRVGPYLTGLLAGTIVAVLWWTVVAVRWMV
jgi:hypothetical protein